MLRTGRIGHQHLRRKLQLARAGMVSAELPDRRSAAEIPPLPGRRVQSRMPHPFRPHAHAVGSGRRDLAPPLADFSARRSRAPRRPRRQRGISDRPPLARPGAVLRILPRRNRRGPGSQPPDRLDRPGRETPATKRRVKKAFSSKAVSDQLSALSQPANVAQPLLAAASEPPALFSQRSLLPPRSQVLTFSWFSPRRPPRAPRLRV
ncbi:hypothetical protein SBA4_3930002 [Candidatus Sulfopaludibacter sp. SbA4]|nr:hypothetical protein SBA4_3930002 [Candidatus Sulfopaludibacter sp. SbA4]